MPKQKYVCRYCGTEDILEDAYARWDVETQQFELSSTHGNAVCENEDCEAQQRCEVDIGEWVEIQEEVGPVPIITATGVQPSNLAAIVEEQHAYYSLGSHEKPVDSK